VLTSFDAIIQLKSQKVKSFRKIFLEEFFNVTIKKHRRKICDAKKQKSQEKIILLEM